MSRRPVSGFAGTATAFLLWLRGWTCPTCRADARCTVCKAAQL